MVGEYKSMSESEFDRVVKAILSDYYKSALTDMVVPNDLATAFETTLAQGEKIRYKCFNLNQHKQVFSYLHKEALAEAITDKGGTDITNLSLCTLDGSNFKTINE